MHVTLIPITESDLTQFKADMQEAFQRGASMFVFRKEIKSIP